MAMTATNGIFQYTSPIDKVQPSSSAGMVIRTGFLNFASGDVSGNYSGSNTTGLGTIMYAGGFINSASNQYMSVANTMSTDGTIYPITKGVTFQKSSTVAATASFIVISST
jgi:hypothetical protein